MTMRAQDGAVTIRSQQQDALRNLPFADTQDFEDAERGLVAPLAGPVTAEDGETIWDNGTNAFITGEAPPTVNPSLWRQSSLVATASTVATDRSPG